MERELPESDPGYINGHFVYCDSTNCVHHDRRYTGCCGIKNKTIVITIMGLCNFYKRRDDSNLKLPTRRKNE